MEPGFGGLVASAMSSKHVQLDCLRVWTGGRSPVKGLWHWTVGFYMPQICGMEDLADGNPKATVAGQEVRHIDGSCIT